MKESIFTNKMGAFLVISYIVSINKLPTKKNGNVDSSLATSALEMLWLDGDLKIFYKCSFFR